MEKEVVLVVQMVRALAQAARGVGSNPTQHYTCPYVLLVVYKRIFNIFKTSNMPPPGFNTP